MDRRVERAVRDPEAVARRGPLRGVLSRVAFWVAVVLPAVYLPLAYAGMGEATIPVSGTTFGVGELVFLSLVGLHAVVLVLGHAHAASGS